MGKAPAFQFYAQDFLVGVMAMTLEQRGAYITLLAAAWDSGGIPEDESTLAQMLGVGSEDFKRIWKGVKSKWVSRDSQLVNPRMEEVRAEQADYREKKSEAGRKGAESRWQPQCDRNASANGKRMALQPSTFSLQSSTSEKRSPKASGSTNARRRKIADPVASRLCRVLYDLILANGTPASRIRPKKWPDSARLMLERDGRDPAEAERLIRWCQADEFWRGAILSMPTFREQYDKVRLRANAQPLREVREHPADAFIRRNLAIAQGATGIPA